MAETVKKANAKPKTPAKTRKSAATKKAAENGTPAANGNGHAEATQIRTSHEQVAELAHHFWAERGRKHGHHEEDWYRAEQELRARPS